MKSLDILLLCLRFSCKHPKTEVESWPKLLLDSHLHGISLRVLGLLWSPNPSPPPKSTMGREHFIFEIPSFLSIVQELLATIVGLCFNKETFSTYDWIAISFCLQTNRGGTSHQKVGWAGEGSERTIGVWGLAPGKFFMTAPSRTSENAPLQG